MAGENEGRSSLKGRFFKKGDPVLDKIEISEYSLEEVCEIDFALADNSFANIYHKTLQPKDKLEQKVKDDRSIRGSLAGDERPAAILGPDNFTNDWNRQRESARRNYYDADDDEASADVKSLLSNAQVSIFGDKGEDSDSAPDHDPQLAQSDDLSSASFKPMASAAPADGTAGSDDFRPLAVPHASAPTDSQQRQESQQHGDPVAAANQDAGQSQIETQGEQLEHIKGSFHAVSHNQQYNVEPLVASPESAADGSHSESALPEDVLQPPSSSSSSSSGSLPSVDDRPNNDGAISSEELAKAQQEAKEAGFTEGVKEAEQQFGDLAAQMQQSIVDVEGLKEQLLNNSRQNFMAIAKAMVGSILQKHIALNPKALDQLITRAIKESVKSDTFTVKVHPTTLAQLQEVSELADKLAADEQVAEGHFKVESDLSVVDGDLNHIISSLLDDVDMELFTDEAS